MFIPRQGMQIITTRTFVTAAINLTAESLSSKYDKGLTTGVVSKGRVVTSRSGDPWSKTDHHHLLSRSKYNP